MSAQPHTRVAASTGWIGGFVALLLLASGTSLFAQEQKEKEKKAPPPVHKGEPARTPPKNEEHPVSRPVNTPPNNPPVHNPPANSSNPPVRPSNTAPPAGNDRPRPNPVTPGGNPSAGAPRNFGRGPTNPGVRGGAPTFNGSRPVFRGSNGNEVHYGSNGQPQVVHARNMTITHGPAGIRRAEFVRPDRSVIVTSGAHYGYVQRPFVVNNVSYVHRTYVVGGVSYGSIYRPYFYHGVSLNLYVAPRFYAPAFYGWAYRPWAAPVVFSFGWAGRPWFGYYGGYFAPYPVYAGPAFWLTDYMLAMSLQAAYQQQMDAGAAAAPPPAYGSAEPALTPDVKQAIADEVRRQLSQEQAVAQLSSAPAPPPPGAPDFLTDNTTHVFVVANALNVPSASGECGLTEGDVIQMTAPPPPNSVSADLAVLASKGQDCRRGSVVTVAVADLQDMQNHMRETLDQGLAELQSKQGQGGIPPEPVAARAAPVTPAYASAAPPPDPNIAMEVSQQSESAGEADSEAIGEAAGSAPPPSSVAPPPLGPPPVAPPSVKLGMTTDQVIQLLGQPSMVGDLGSKKIYSYGTMKVVFTDGRVSDIQ